MNGMKSVRDVRRTHRASDSTHTWIHHHHREYTTTGLCAPLSLRVLSMPRHTHTTRERSAPSPCASHTPPHVPPPPSANPSADHRHLHTRHDRSSSTNKRPSQPAAHPSSRARIHRGRGHAHPSLRPLSQPFCPPCRTDTPPLSQAQCAYTANSTDPAPSSDRAPASLTTQHPFMLPIPRSPACARRQEAAQHPHEDYPCAMAQWIFPRGFTSSRAVPPRPTRTSGRCHGFPPL